MQFVFLCCDILHGVYI